MSSSTSKYAYKALPQFNLTYYRAWAADVHDAFAERKWLPYLLSSTATDSSTSSTDTSLSLDPDTMVKAKAFLNQSIPYEHKAGIESCTTAAEIWLAFQQRYASQSREDELRLEGQLLDFKKLATDTIDQHITKFDALIASIIAQQPINQRYDDTKKNRYFLRTLETAQIPNEDWKGFITFLGKTWLTISTHALFSEARTYYNTHIQPYFAPSYTSSSTSTPSASSTDATALKTHSSNDNNWQSRNSDSDNDSESDNSNDHEHRHDHDDNQHHYNNFNNRKYNNHNDFNNRNNYNKFNDNFSVNNNRNRFPNSRFRSTYDPHSWCPYCRRKGHSYEQCISKTRDPDYLQHLEQSSHSQHSDY